MFVFGIDIPLHIVLIFLLLLSIIQLVLLVKALKRLTGRETLQVAINKVVSTGLEETDEEPGEALPEIADEEEAAEEPAEQQEEIVENHEESEKEPLAKV